MNPENEVNTHSPEIKRNVSGKRREPSTPRQYKEVSGKRREQSTHRQYEINVRKITWTKHAPAIRKMCPENDVNEARTGKTYTKKWY